MMKFQGVMLAQELSKQKKPITEQVACEDKEDGFRILHLNGQNYTRGGNHYETFRPFSEAFLEIVGKDVCVDTEMCASNWNEASKLLKRINNLDPKAIKEKVIARIFDVFTYDDLTVPYLKRRHEVLHVAKEVVGVGSGHRFEAVKRNNAKTPADIQKAMDAALARRKEGLIVKTLDGIYVPSPVGKSPRRSKFWLKQKTFKDITVTLVRAEYQTGLCPECSMATSVGIQRDCSVCGGTGKVDKPDILGAWICVNDKGQEIRVGSGYTLEQREEHWKNRKKWAGRKMDVKVQDDKLNDIVARHPVYLDRFRDDL